MIRRGLPTDDIALTIQYLQINTWAFPYWPGYHPDTKMPLFELSM